MSGADPISTDVHLGESILDVAGSRSLSALGQACHRGVTSLLGPAAIGLYFIVDRSPRLFFSKHAPQGFIEEYDREAYRDDPILAYVLEERRPVDGAMLLGTSNWERCHNYELLRRWGFIDSMAGPLIVDDRLVGIFFAANGPRSKDRGEIETIHLLCSATSLALGHMMEMGKISESGEADQRDRISAALQNLPDRSREVATLVCQGHSNKEIARTLGISAHTVKDHIERLCKRLKAQNRTALVQRMLSQDAGGRV